MNFVCLDGELFPGDKPLLMPANRAFRYGDGLFETLKVAKGRILLKDLHFERLFNSLAALQYAVPASFNVHTLEQQVLQLVKQNGCENLGRVRLTVFRGNGGLYEGKPHFNYLIESQILNEVVNLNEEGLVIGIYPGARKPIDPLSNIKSANFLPYAMAALYAEKNNLDDCIVLNTNENIADTTIANIFQLKENELLTPALSEGCVNGVMRRLLISQCHSAGFPVHETSITVDDLFTADEIFLTNAIQGIRWVKSFREKLYMHVFARKLYNDFVKIIS